jgi:hypothetical protein
MAKLIKLSHDVEEMNPNGIHQGYTKESTVSKPYLPIVGSSYWFGSLLTSVVTGILSEDENGFIFKTMNSTYQVIYD